MDMTTLPWRKFNPLPQADSDNWWAHRAWTMAEEWLSDFGIDLGAYPNAFGRGCVDRWAFCVDRWAFRIDSAGKSIVVRVDIDEGHSKACRVEVELV